MEPVEDIVIVGAGIAGLATALGLHRKGFRSLVLESSPKLRASGYALGIWTNAWHALDALGIGNAVRERHILLEWFKLLSPSSGATLAEVELNDINGKNGKLEIRAVSRQFLIETMEKELPNDTIRYSSKVGSIEEESNLKILHLADGSVIKTKILIGGDGINSVVAKYLGLKKPSFSGRRLSAIGLAEYQTNHGYKSEFVQINGQGFRAGMLPSTEKSIYWFFSWSPSENEMVNESAITVRETVIKALSNAKAPEEFIDVIQRTEMDQFVSNPVKYRSPLSILFGDITKRGICVIGDAFHPTTPDLGQGGCIALEDTVVLVRCLSKAFNQGKIEEGLEEFAKIRRLRCAMVVAISFVVGIIQKSGNSFVSILREKVLAGILAAVLLKVADFDCGKL